MRHGARSGVAVVGAMLAACFSEPAEDGDAGGSEDGTGSASAADSSSGDPSDAASGDPSGDAGESGAPSTACGDDVLDPDELCDDGNTADGDGCNADCRPSGEVTWWSTEPGTQGADEFAYGIATTPGGGAVVTGDYALPDPELGTMWIRRYGADGALEADQLLPNPGNDRGSAIATDTDGNTYATGGMSSVQGLGIWTARFNTDNTQEWALAEMVPGQDLALGVAVLDVDEPIVVGHQLGAAGDEAWVGTYPGGSSAAGRTARFSGPAATPARASGVAVQGQAIYVVGSEGPPGSEDAWVRRLDPALGEEWKRPYANPPANDILADVAVAGDGTVLVCGWTKSAAGAFESHVAAYAPDGDQLWQQGDAGPNQAGALWSGVAVDALGRVVLVGAEVTGPANHDRAPLVRKLELDGSPLYTRVLEFGGHEIALLLDVAVGLDDQIRVAGGVLTDSDGVDVLVAQLTP